MSPHTLLSAFIGLNFLGINWSLCLGAKDSQFLSELVDLQENIEPENNKRSPQLMKIIQQYASKMSDGKDEENTGMEGMTDAMKKLGEGDLEGGEEQFLAKRLAKIQRGFGDIFKSRPGFRNWGGKRFKFDYGGKRTSFSRWGGKRSKFNNWGGKRSKKEKLIRTNKYMFEKRDPEYSVPYEQGGPEEDDFLKRNGFKTWAGKRVSDTGFDRSRLIHFLYLPRAGKTDIKQDETLKKFQNNVEDMMNSISKDEHMGENYSFNDIFEDDKGPDKIKFHAHNNSR